MSGLRAAKKRETRKVILETAVQLFSERGYDATSVEGLAREAGIGKGTIYGYFRTKEEILLAFCEEELDYAFAALAEKTNPDAPLLEQLITLFMSQFTFVTANREFGRYLVRETAFPKEGPSERSRELDSRFLTAVQELLDRARQRGEVREDYDPFLAAVHFYSLYLVALSGWYTQYVTTHEEVETSLRQLLRQALEGLGTHGEKG